MGYRKEIDPIHWDAIDQAGYAWSSKQNFYTQESPPPEGWEAWNNNLNAGIQAARNAAIKALGKNAYRTVPDGLCDNPQCKVVLRSSLCSPTYPGLCRACGQRAEEARLRR